MSDIISIEHMHKDFKQSAELQEFAQKQTALITKLSATNSELLIQIEQLKQQLAASIPLLGQSEVERIIVSPERALLDDQILMIQQRAYAKELSLEDVKKLDLLLKNKNLLVAADQSIKGQSKPVGLSSKELLQIVSDGK